jgi:hypothetical protein
MTTKKTIGGHNKGIGTHSDDTASGRGLAKKIGTPLKEYEKAKELGILHPACGVPNFEELDKIFDTTFFADFFRRR